MDPEVAKVVAMAITAVGAVVWLAALASVLRETRARRESAEQATDRFEIESDLAPGTIVGEAEVEGQPEELSAKLASQLAKDGMGPLGPIKILSRDRHEVAFEPAGHSVLGFRAGRVRLTPSGSKTRIEYAVETSRRGHYLLVGGAAFLILGLAVLIVAPTLAFVYLIPNPDPIARSEVLQLAQMVHFLWPPFLFTSLSRQPARMFRARMESLVHNLPYT
jgi:hypothetical protein